MLVLCVLPIALGANADTKECRDVDSLAVVTAFDTVTWRGDKAAKTCRFTVGLAPTPSASKQAVGRLGALRDELSDFNRRWVVFSDMKSGFETTAILLAAATDNASLPDAGMTQLKSPSVQKTMSNCFDAVRNRVVATHESEGSHFLCKVSVAPFKETEALYFSAMLRVGESGSEQSFGASIPLPR